MSRGRGATKWRAHRVAGERATFAAELTGGCRLRLRYESGFMLAEVQGKFEEQEKRPVTRSPLVSAVAAQPPPQAA
jgi:hypothetical protein